MSTESVLLGTEASINTHMNGGNFSTRSQMVRSSLREFGLLPAVNKKVTFNLEQVVKAQMGEYRYNSTLSLTTALDGGGCLTPRPGRFTPGKETRYSVYRRLGGP